MANKIGIIGMGAVGSSVAFSLLVRGVAGELVLNDIHGEIAEGEAMDLAHGAPFYPAAKVTAGGIDDLLDADAVVVAVGRGGIPGVGRLQLLRDNAATVDGIGRRLAGARGIVIVVTNPVDVLTHLLTAASGLSPARVIGTGTMLDTARLRQMLGAHFDLDPRSIHAQVAGEHGDSEVVLWSGARIGGVALRDWPGWSPERERGIEEALRGAAQAIIRRKGPTNHAIGLVTAALLDWILRGTPRLLTVSRVQDGAFGLRDVALSLPTVVGRQGAAQVLEPAMSATERDALVHSAAVLRRAIASARLS